MLNRILFIGAIVFGSAVVMADPRPFTFVYDTYPVGKGNWEFEQGVTYRTRTDDEPGFDRFDFREEIEFGVADNFDLAFYLPSWRYEDSDERTGTKFDSVDVESILYLSNPTTDALGAALYMEIGVGDEEEENEVEGELENLLGVSYALTPAWLAGGEVIIASEFPDWDQYEDTTVYAGPVISYQGAEHWWVTVTPTFLLSNQDDEPQYQIRMIAGISF
jgi:hypothetical protein